jgi:Holliday junction resolvase RusA-like endonuclease
MAAMTQITPHKDIFDGPVEVRVTAYYKGQRPDLSGVCESVGDCLEGIAWENDRQIESWDGSRLYHDKKDPRTIVEVMEYKEV